MATSNAIADGALTIAVASAMTIGVNEGSSGCNGGNPQGVRDLKEGDESLYGHSGRHR